MNHFPLPRRGRLRCPAAIFVCLSLTCLAPFAARSAPAGFTNSVGTRMVALSPGEFSMGDTSGEWDEQPVHRVSLSKPFLMSATPVTNLQYEQFDPSHRHWRGAGNDGFPSGDHDAVTFVSWKNADAFCRWLTTREGKSYRLPTEAEWEYAAKTAPARFEQLTGGVEQWVFDWYGPYPVNAQRDPAGYRTGTTRVTRGGIEWVAAGKGYDAKWVHGPARRVANRMSFLEDDRYGGLGFRVVVAGAPASFLPAPPLSLNARDVSQERYDWLSHQPDPAKPYFSGPIDFVRLPAGVNGPLFPGHNHFPAITWCPNGDLLATWYSGSDERGTQLNIAASRLRRGQTEWEEASPFWVAADRNNHSATLWTDPASGRIYHFQGVGSRPDQRNQILMLRTSEDSGATWTEPRIILPGRSMWNPHVVTRTREGELVVTSDVNFEKPIWGRIVVSRDGGATWQESPGRILGQHPGIVQLKDGSLLAVGRDDWNPQHAGLPGVGVPFSLSRDLGKTWTYRREPALGFGIGMGQRPVLIRLAEGPLLYIGFTDPPPDLSYKLPAGADTIEITDAAGKRRRVHGMFSALSFDEGVTWGHLKLLTPGPELRHLDGGGNTGRFDSDVSHAEPRGYIQSVQSPDGIIQLVSSRLHYRFNYNWLLTPAGAEPSTK